MNNEPLKEALPYKVHVRFGNEDKVFQAYAIEEKIIRPFFTKEEGLLVCDFLNKFDSESHLEYVESKDMFRLTTAYEDLEEYPSNAVLTEDGLKILYPIGSIFPGNWNWKLCLNPKQDQNNKTSS